MLYLLASRGLIQQVQGPTHRAGHTLDILLPRSSETTLSDVDMRDPGLSDHLAIISTLHLYKPPLLRKHALTRGYQRIWVDDLHLDLQICEQVLSLPEHVHLAVARYETALGTLIDKYAPLRGKTVTIRSDVEWFDDDIHGARRQRRKLSASAENHSIKVRPQNQIGRRN